MVYTRTARYAYLSGFSPCSFRRCCSLPGKMALRAGAAKRNDRASKIKAANRFINFPFKRSQINFLAAFRFVRPSIKSHFPALPRSCNRGGCRFYKFQPPPIHDFSSPSFVSRVLPRRVCPVRPGGKVKSIEETTRIVESYRAICIFNDDKVELRRLNNYR